MCYLNFSSYLFEHKIFNIFVLTAIHLATIIECTYIGNSYTTISILGYSANGIEVLFLIYTFKEYKLYIFDILIVTCVLFSSDDNIAQPRQFV